MCTPARIALVGTITELILIAKTPLRPYTLCRPEDGAALVHRRQKSLSSSWRVYAGEPRTHRSDRVLFQVRVGHRRQAIGTVEAASPTLTPSIVSVFTEQPVDARVALIWLERGPVLTPAARITRHSRHDVEIAVAGGMDLVVVGLLWLVRYHELAQHEIMFAATG